jgi:hypothetical protein
MRQSLRLHPDSYCTAVTQIDVDVARADDGGLALRYAVTGRMEDVRLPPVTAPARTDELWRHTCFEAFVHRSPDHGYCEFNFSPSTQWAAYRFDGYRHGMQTAAEIEAPPIAIQTSRESCTLRVALALPRLPREAVWRIGLAAVIEETSGNKSYWALAHPAGKPDFHHVDGFALELS